MRIREEAVRDWDLELARDLDQVVAPVILTWNGEAWWEQIPYTKIKDLRKSVKDYGRTSPYFKNLLDLTFMGHTLTPQISCNWLKFVSSHCTLPHIQVVASLNSQSFASDSSQD